MKKFFSMLVMVLLMISLAGCSKSMNYVIGNEPSFVGTVEVVTDEYVLVADCQPKRTPVPYSADS